MNRTEIFETELNYLKNEDMKTFAETILNNLPDYFFMDGASSTGKYHAPYAQGYGGLKRHVKAGCKFLNYAFQLEQYQEEFSEYEMDCAIVAFLAHDGFKLGTNNSRFSVHNHPTLCAEWIRTSEQLDNIIDDDYRELIAQCVETHMGQWNTNKRSKVILPKPSTRLQKMVHFADYLSSRPDISIDFSEDDGANYIPDPKDFKLSFGKYNDYTLDQVYQVDAGYLKWGLQNNVGGAGTIFMIKDYLEKKENN